MGRPWNSRKRWMQTSTKELPISNETSALLTRLMKLEELKALKDEQKRRQSRRKIDTYYPESGPLRRELYDKHMEFFAAGAYCRETRFFGGNRGRTTTGGGGV